MLSRKQIFKGIGTESVFLWGARQTGKSTLLKQMFPEALWIDLLLSDVYRRFTAQPQLLREMLQVSNEQKLVVIDEIQKVPELLDEIHWLMVNQKVQFILSGSSPRKIIRSGANLLGGRALRYELFPLVSAEIDNFQLNTALNHGLLPRHYLSANPKKLIDAYIGNYLNDEIVAEAKIRNVQAFTQFLRAAAFSNAEQVNYSNIASDCGVSHNTIREYFQILEDTLIGRFLPVYQKKPKRKVIQSPKFYFFDLGIPNNLLKRGVIESGTEAFGHAFEHFIYQELYAHSKYSELDYPISYWRTVNQVEVDFILGENQVCIEVKGTDNVNSKHLKGLKSFSEEYTTQKRILVSLDPFERMVGDVHLMPWNVFLHKLWNGELIS
jgi:predicted AAA+ superfamily ATPase